MINASVVVVSSGRPEMFRRCLWAIDKTMPTNIRYEVVVVDNSKDNVILNELKTFSSRFFWVYVRFGDNLFYEQTGVKSNRCSLINAGVAKASSDVIFEQDGEVVVGDCAYSLMLDKLESANDTIVFSNVYLVPPKYIELLEPYGQNLFGFRDECYKYPVQTSYFDNRNCSYLSLYSKDMWNRAGGYDERGELSSSFVNRCPNVVFSYAEAFKLECELSEEVFDLWEGRANWRPGDCGIIEVQTNRILHV